MSREGCPKEMGQLKESEEVINKKILPLFFMNHSIWLGHTYSNGKISDVCKTSGSQYHVKKQVRKRNIFNNGFEVINTEQKK